MAWVCSECALGLFGLAGQVLKYRLPGPYLLAHLFHAHPRGESYCDFSAVVTLVFSTSIGCCTQALCLVTASGAHDGSSVLPLTFVFFPSDHLRAVLEGSLFWGGSSCVVDIPQGLMTSVPYDQPDCWCFCLPATAFGPSTDSLACTSMRKDCQDKAAARSPDPLGVVFRSGSTLLCSSLNLLKTWFLYFPRCSTSRYKYWDAVDIFSPLIPVGIWGTSVFYVGNMLFTTPVFTCWIFLSVPFLFLCRTVSHLLYLYKTKNCGPTYHKDQNARNDLLSRPTYCSRKSYHFLHHFNINFCFMCGCFAFLSVLYMLAVLAEARGGPQILWKWS